MSQRIVDDRRALGFAPVSCPARCLEVLRHASAPSRVTVIALHAGDIPSGTLRDLPKAYSRRIGRLHPAAGMNNGSHGLTFMIFGDFNLESVAFPKLETNSPAGVDHGPRLPVAGNERPLRIYRDTKSG